MVADLHAAAGPGKDDLLREALPLLAAEHAHWTTAPKLVRVRAACRVTSPTRQVQAAGPALAHPAAAAEGLFYSARKAGTCSWGTCSISCVKGVAPSISWCAAFQWHIQNAVRLYERVLFWRR